MPKKNKKISNLLFSSLIKEIETIKKELNMKNNANQTTTIKHLESYLGKEKIFLLDHSIDKNIEVISTGSYNLDKVLGIDGWPKGRIVEIYGGDSTGKSTLALHAALECQKAQGNVAYIDLENSLDSNWANKIGLNLEQLLVSKPENGEQCFAIINALVKTKMVDMIIIDSVAAMTPKIELENSIEDQTMGLHARLMSKGLRILQSNLINSKTIIIFINQVREKIGFGYGPTTVTTGGKALKYASSIRLELKKQETIKDGVDAIGINVKVTTYKNKLAAPMRTGILNLYFDRGFDYQSEIIDLAIKTNVIIKKGAWYSYKEQNLAQGLKALRNKLLESNELFQEIEQKVKISNENKI